MHKPTLAAVLLAAAVATAQESPATKPGQQSMPVGLGEAQPTAMPAMDESWRQQSLPAHPRFAGEISVGGGEFEHRTKGSDLDDSTGGVYFRMHFEGYSDRGFGGGIRLEGVGSEDDLFSGTSYALSQASSSEVFLYFAYRPPELRTELPLRVGLMFHDYGLEENATGDRIDYTSVGLRFEVMPDFVLAESESLRWSLYGGASLAFGSTRIQTDPGTIEADSSTTMFGLDLGMRLRFSHANLGIGWVYRDQTIDDSDPVGGLYFLGVDQTFSGLLLSFGLTF